jgi:hypothetical protein
MPDEFTVPPGPIGSPPGDVPPGPEAADLAPGATGAATAAVAAPDRRTATLARIGLLGIAAAALVAVAMLAFGSTLAPARTLAGSDSTGTTGGTGITGGAEEPSLFGGPGLGRGHGIMFGGITITAINGNDLSLETEDGWTRTITVDDGTQYSKSGNDIAFGDLAVGDRIAFRQTLEGDGSWTIDAIAVILPHVGGVVTSVDGSTITVEGRDGEPATITVNGDTEYQVNNDDATLADVEVGMVLIAEGTDNGEGSITATKVKAFDRDGFFGGRGFGPGRPGLGFGPGFDWNGDRPNTTAAPQDGASAS